MSWPCARLRSWLCRSQRLIWRRMDGLLVWVVVCPHTAPQHLPESRTTYPGQQILLFFWPDPAHCHFWSAGYKPYRWKGTNFAIDLNAWLPSSTEFVNWFLLACFEFNTICFCFISRILEQLGVGSTAQTLSEDTRREKDWSFVTWQRCVSLNLGTFGGLCDYLYKSLTK
jgi:hypothetical protein